jgi:hypothetical protein
MLGVENPIWGLCQDDFMPTKLPAIVKSQGFDPMFKWSESFIDSVRADFILLYPSLPVILAKTSNGVFHPKHFLGLLFIKSVALNVTQCLSGVSRLLIA